MPQFLENKYLNDLITKYETEINFAPIEIELDSKKITEKDISMLLNFVADTPKRLFIFKIPGNEHASNKLAFIARRTNLNKTSAINLKNAASTPKINPLKSLLKSSNSARTNIQIQKSFDLPKPSSAIKKSIHSQLIETGSLNKPILLDLGTLSELPRLMKQLNALGIQFVEEEALLKIKKHTYAFKDGIIPKNLPKGFYIDLNKSVLCYSKISRKLPSGLAPTLEMLQPLTLPTKELIEESVPSLSAHVIQLFMKEKYSEAQKNALIKQLSLCELNDLLKSLASNANEIIIPFLCKQYLLGGEAHVTLLIKLLKAALSKKINIDFIKSPEVQRSLSSTQGIKNLQKLVNLPQEQREWWITLVTGHLNYDKNSFDFNTFFETYTQEFLPRIAKKELTLPVPCPIEHKGHMLITLNRVLDVIENAENPQEQSLSLERLDWGPTGIHYAMMEKQFKYVASCMELKNPEDAENTSPEFIYKKLEDTHFMPKPWAFRYMAQHWKKEITLSDINTQLDKIDKLTTWTTTQKNQLTFILTSTFSDKTVLTTEEWKELLNRSISLLQPLAQETRSELLQALSRCFKFKPNPSFAQIIVLIDQCIKYKNNLNPSNLKNQFITPLISCLEEEGFALLNLLQEKIQKINPENSQLLLSYTASFIAMLQKNRKEKLSFDHIKLFATLAEPEITQKNIDDVTTALCQLTKAKGADFSKILLNLLSQINVAKSQSLPTVEHIKKLIEKLTNIPENIPSQYVTQDKKEIWLKDLIINQALLTQCVLGNGDISKLDDLIVDAMTDAVRKRSAVLTQIDVLKQSVFDKINSQTNDNMSFTEKLKAKTAFVVTPSKLKKELIDDITPFFDIIKKLIDLLNYSSNPKFQEIIDHLQIFEKIKTKLLSKKYNNIGKMEDILDLVLAGKITPKHNTIFSLVQKELLKLHDLIFLKMESFFNDPQKKHTVKDLDINICRSWIEEFNNTHSLIFFFKEEIIQKKVIPELKKTLGQLNTQDSNFEQSILKEASEISENVSSDKALQSYKEKITEITNYLNLLIEMNNKFPTEYKHLHTAAQDCLNYTQKRILMNHLKNKPEELNHYLKLTAQILQQNSHANSVAIERAINGLSEFFETPDLDPENQTLFFKMSMSHNLNSTSPFPLAALKKLKNSNLPEKDKSSLTKQIVQILKNLPNQSPIPELIYKTQEFLTNNPSQIALCNALLQRIFQDKHDHNLKVYLLILEYLSKQSDLNKREKFATILTRLAGNKKDNTAKLSALLEIVKGLDRHLGGIDLVLNNLFAIRPYPTTENLNHALLEHDDARLKSYCLSFDMSPFAKLGEKRNLAKQFTTDRITEALTHLKDLLHEIDFPHSLHQKLAKQLTYIETLGYIDPLNPKDFNGLKALTAKSRSELKEHACFLLKQLRSKSIDSEQIEVTQLELLAYLREIYFRTTNLFPNTTQMLTLLLALEDPSSNLLMCIKTGEGKSIIAPILSVLQWMQSGTVDQCTASPTLLTRDFENYCKPFFEFLDIKTALISRNTSPEEYQLDGINCSTLEDMSLFRLTAKESKKEKLLESNDPIHVILDECDDALLDQVTLYTLVAKTDDLHQNDENNPAQWLYPLAYQFTQSPEFRNIDSAQGEVWDEEEDLHQFRIFLNRKIKDQFNSDTEKQNYLLASSNTQLKQWIHASCTAATLVENKHFVVQAVQEKDAKENTKKYICVPLIHGIPKLGSIFTEAVQQALHARLKEESPKNIAQHFHINAVSSVLASQSAHGLIKFYQKTEGRLLGISGTLGDKQELESLATSLGIQAVSIEPHAGEARINHEPIFTLNRKETFKTLHKVLNQLKRPITKPHLEMSPDVAYHEYSALNEQIKHTLEEWNHTQTQPILIINEDFDEVKALGTHLDVYKKQGFRIQIITGQETSDELDYIIKQAGQVNTITVSTAMLARGTDINTGLHPKGLFVIQTYPDTKRMSTQIAGRAARNGKPGAWLPIYQVKTPQNLRDKIAYYLFPWRRKWTNQYQVEKLKNEIKHQATIDRLYSQAIDQIQQTLTQQIEAWESLLLELHPNDPEIQFELYQWREKLLSELTRVQETSISEETLTESISQFKNIACNLWQITKEEQWITKAKASTLQTYKQELRLKYLMELDISQELNIQTKLQQKNKLLTSGTDALMHQNLELIVANKAGAVLNYIQPTEEMKRKLLLAQSNQLLPNLIDELSRILPKEMDAFLPQKKSKKEFLIPSMISKIIKKFIGSEKKKKITQHFQKELMDADDNKIQSLLLDLKKPFLTYCKEVSKLSFGEQFKTQSLIFTFYSLYNNLGLPEDAELNELKTNYNEEIIKKLAQYLTQEFSWIKAIPQSFHAFLERGVAKKAVRSIYNLAEELNNSPPDKNKVQALYRELKKQHIILKNKHLFSIKHNSPRQVIHDVLNAIDSLNNVLYCDQGFRYNCHEYVISEQQLAVFHNYLEKISFSRFFNYLAKIPLLAKIVKTHDESIWNHLKKELFKISQQSHDDNPGHIIQELYEAINRFITYKKYKPYLKQLNELKKQLQGSLNKLNNIDGLQERLLTQKTTPLATLLKVNPHHMHIQKSSNGIQDYIEVEIENESSQEGFISYQSPFISRIDSEQKKLNDIKEELTKNKNKLLELSDINAIQSIPNKALKTIFERLFRLHALLTQDWNNKLDRTEFPEFIQEILRQADAIKYENSQNPSLELIMQFKENLDESITNLIDKIIRNNTKLKFLRNKIEHTQNEIKACDTKTASIQTLIDTERKENADSFMTQLAYRISKQQSEKKEQINILEKEKRPKTKLLKQLERKEKETNLELQRLDQLIKPKHPGINQLIKEEQIKLMIQQAQQALKVYLEETSKQGVDAVEKELNDAQSEIDRIQLEELKKTRYQTRRFFKTADLLNYEAHLAKEEELIPKMHLS